METTVNIRIEKVNYKNYDSLIDLTVDEEQRNYVADNIYSLAEAYAAAASGRAVFPFGIYRDNEPVGFLMIGYITPEEAEEERVGGEELPAFVEGSYLLWRFMIDKRYQKMGYGREALKLALGFIRSFPCGEAEYCWLSYEPENEVAKKLYRSFGFKEVPEMPKGWDEIPALLKL